jgi:hypothetical protein
MHFLIRAAWGSERVISCQQPIRKESDFCTLDSGNVSAKPGEIVVHLACRRITENLAHEDGTAVMGNHAADEIDVMLTTQVDLHASVHEAVRLNEVLR